MTGPKNRPRIPRPLENTVADERLTKTLVDRERREIALEKASEAAGAPDEDGEAPVVVVLGPDGVPQIADPADLAPETVRVDLPDPPPKRQG